MGLDHEAVLALRQARVSGDAHDDALARFVLHLVTTSGSVQTDVVTEVKQAGVNDAQIVDVAMAIASIAFTNLFNRINDTALDFPAADQCEGRRLRQVRGTALHFSYRQNPARKRSGFTRLLYSIRERRLLQASAVVSDGAGGTHRIFEVKGGAADYCHEPMSASLPSPPCLVSAP
jgi:hypothetical protein